MCIHMRQHRQLLAVLLVAVYAVASTFGVAFVTCVESDGRQNVEALGAACCTTGATLPGDALGSNEAPELAASSDEGCGDCEVHLPVVEIDSVVCEDSQPHPISLSLPAPPSPPSIVAWLLDGDLDRNVRRSRARPPQSSHAIACLRTVILRC